MRHFFKWFQYSCLSWFISYCALFSSPAVIARVLNPEEASAVVLNEDLFFNVQSDGTYTRLWKQSLKINNAQGIKEWGTLSYNFPGDGYVIESVKASITNDGSSTDVDPQNIALSSTGGDNSIFDDNQKITISFPGVRIDSILVIEIASKMTKTSIPGHFSISRTYGSNLPVENASLKVRSERRLHYAQFNSIDAFKIRETKNKGHYLYMATSQKKIFSRIGFEPSDIYTQITPRHVAIRFSSDREYADLARRIIPFYEKSISAPLPQQYKAIVADSIRQSQSLKDHVDFIFSQIMETHRYMGDWRTAQGSHLPRSLADISLSQYGDCKDFSVITTAMLRSLGFKAHVAWVYRNTVNNNVTEPLAYLDEFNHAIVHVEFEGKSYWLDPTNNTSVGLRIREDLLDRYALILDQDDARLEKTSLNNPAHSMGNYTKIISHDQDGSISTQYKLEATGLVADYFNQYFATVPRKNFKETWLYIIRKDYPNGLFTDFKLRQPRNRISSDIELTTRINYFPEKNQTSSGYAYQISDNISMLSRIDTANHVSDVFLTYPQTKSEKHILKNAKLVGTAEKPCHVKSDWVDYERQITQTKDDILIKIKATIKRNQILRKEMKTERFQLFLKDMRKCAKDYQVIYQTI